MSASLARDDAPAPDADPLLAALNRARAASLVAETAEQQYVREARKVGYSWRVIGNALGMSESGARKRYVPRGIF